MVVGVFEYTEWPSEYMRLHLALWAGWHIS